MTDMQRAANAGVGLVTATIAILAACAVAWAAWSTVTLALILIGRAL